MEGLWAFVVTAGPILLALIVGIAIWRNRKQRNQVPLDVTERATRENRAAAAEENKRF